MKLDKFFSRHPVFTVDELTQFLESQRSTSRWTRKALLAYHRKRGRLLRVRRGLYAVVPPGVPPERCPLDPYLLTAKMAQDAVLAYHTALAFHGKAYSVHERFVYQTARPHPPTRFRSYSFRAVVFPKALRDKRATGFDVKTAERAGVPVKVASLERTLVDVLDRPDLCGGWEEIWRSLELVEFFDVGRVVEYVLLLGNATTAAKVGFYLDQHREELMVEEGPLRRLHERQPKRPHYLDRTGGEPGRFVSAWNLVVPVSVVEQAWAEVR